ncbi:hypothetical protein GCM10015535_59910 [Streptomyces gelaticus]|uniref:DUF3103 family protein n=1 Tax=Streptomyces gelaticus TaxID=285446 RepID=A0ABQ2W7D1_9ACTN|nr:DUF3103 family protein [Streptomyces gelaticus]GGV94458.1 hypothetical protein GCM10015535_59910 [Streptomyces gelaticus]
MSTSTPLRTALIGVTLAATALIPLQGTALAAPTGTNTAATATASSVSFSSSVSGIEDATALALARSLADPDWSREVRRAALAADSVGLGKLTGDAAAPAGRKLAAGITAADRGVAAAKGLGSGAGSLLRLGLADASMQSRLASGTAPLVAAAPSDDGGSAFTAYDSRGAAHELSLDSVPDRPVYLVDIDGAKAVAEGLKVIDKALESRGLSVAAPAAGTSTQAAAGIDTTRIDSVRIGDVKEPFFKGDAEIFTLVTGFGKDGKPRVDTVEMPYLNEEDTTCYPGQVLVNWSNYKYDLADAVMMEDDGDTNYQALAKAIATVLLTITDQGAYIPLADALLDAIPTSWWTDDPDYVDSWYTLARSSSGTRNGAAGNGWMTVSPYHVPEL